MKNGKAIGALVKGTACSLTALLAFACGNSQQGMMPTAALAVMTVEPTSQELNSTYPTTIRGKQDIEIRPRVSGHIVKLCVDEGAVVRKGQPLFLIDAVPYQKQVQAAAATVEVAKANVETNKLTLESKTQLHAQNIISDYDPPKLIWLRQKLIWLMHKMTFHIQPLPAHRMALSVPSHTVSVV